MTFLNNMSKTRKAFGHKNSAKHSYADSYHLNAPNVAGTSSIASLGMMGVQYATTKPPNLNLKKE